MRIIIEGVDELGKSILVSKIRQKYKLDSLNITSKDPSTFEFFKSLILKSDLVTNRDFISEMIWPEIFNIKSNLNFRKFEKLVSLSKEIDAKIIVLTAPIETLITRTKDRRIEESLEALNNLEKIDNMFRYYAGLCRAPVVDISDMTFDQFCKLYIEGNESVKVKDKDIEK